MTIHIFQMGKLRLREVKPSAQGGLRVGQQRNPASLSFKAPAAAMTPSQGSTLNTQLPTSTSTFHAAAAPVRTRQSQDSGRGRWTQSPGPQATQQGPLTPQTCHKHALSPYCVRAPFQPLRTLQCKCPEAGTCPPGARQSAAGPGHRWPHRRGVRARRQHGPAARWAFNRPWREWRCPSGGHRCWRRMRCCVGVPSSSGSTVTALLPSSSFLGRGLPPHGHDNHLTIPCCLIRGGGVDVASGVPQLRLPGAQDWTGLAQASPSSTTGSGPARALSPLTA